VSNRPEAMVFSLVGVDYKIIEKHEDTKLILEEILRKGYKIVLVDEELAGDVYKVRERVFKDLKEPPLIVIMPSLSGIKSTRLEYLKDLVSKAVGARLKW